MRWIRQSLEFLPSFSVYEKHVSTIEQSVENNPSLCIDTCKSLLEGLCKSILNNRNVDSAQYEKFQQLVKATIQEISSDSDMFRDEISELAKRFSPSLQYLSELRNKYGFASHGQDIETPQIPYSLALLSMRITDTIGGFILHFYISHAKRSDSKLHYEDLSMFNDIYDDEHPVELNGISISASLALFQQDYEAYKEAFLAYLNENLIELANDSV